MTTYRSWSLTVHPACKLFQIRLFSLPLSFGSPGGLDLFPALQLGNVCKSLSFGLGFNRCTTLSFLLNLELPFALSCELLLAIVVLRMGICDVAVLVVFIVVPATIAIGTTVLLSEIVAVVSSSSFLLGQRSEIAFTGSGLDTRAVAVGMAVCVVRVEHV